MMGLLQVYDIKRVFILGAGFSAPFGIPITNQLLSYVYDTAKQKTWYLEKDEKSKNGMGDWLLEELNWYYPLENITDANIKSIEINIEQFFSYVASHSAFLYNTGDRWNEHGDKFTVFLKCWLGETIWNLQNNALRKELSWFNKMLNLFDNSIVLTFNWDTILESLLLKAGKEVAFDLHSTYQKSCTPIIKYHGSIDWFSTPDEQAKESWMQYEEISGNLTGLVRDKNNPLEYYNSTLPIPPWIVTPGYDKISEILKFGHHWQTPWIYLQDNVEVVIIGYSLRPDDYHSRAFIYPQLVDGTKSDRLKIKVIDLAHSCSERKAIKDRYKGVQNIEYFFDGFGEKAIDWIIKN